MKNQPFYWDDDLELALELAKRALEVCDEKGLMLAAIDLCAATEKLEAMRNAIT